MVPTSFDQSNSFFERPRDMTDDECSALSVYLGAFPDDSPVVITCWKMTREELAKVNETGRIWLLVRGRMMPVVALCGESPFEEPLDELKAE